MENKKILLIYVSAGGGHKSAALAVSKTFQEKYADIEVKTVDALDYTNKLYKKLYISSYLFMVKKAPKLWGYLYKTYDTRKILPAIEELRKLNDRISARKLIKYILEYNPDVVMATHFLPVDIISYMKKEELTKTLLACVITDYCAHPVWIKDNVDVYFVAAEHVKREVEKLNQPAEKIIVTGIPVNPVFKRKLSKNDAREKLGLKSETNTLLLLAGGFGVGPVTHIVRAFRDSGSRLQLIVVCGKSEELEKQVRSITKDMESVKVYGFTDNVNELMSAADLVLSKTGGMTVSEALAINRPVVILDPIPGQEQCNCEFLLANGAGVRLYNPDIAPVIINQLLRDKQKMKQMEENALKISKPNAAEDIAKYISQRV